MSGTEIGVLKEKALRCELLPASDIKWICEKAREVFAAEDNVVNIASRTHFERMPWRFGTILMDWRA